MALNYHHASDHEYSAMRAPNYSDDEISLIDVWRALAEGKWIIVIVTATVMAIATAAAFLMTPIYRSEVLLAVQADNSGAAGLGGQLGGLASLAGLRIGSNGNERTQAIAMLGSRVLTERFIRQHELLPILFSDIWDSERKTWLLDDPAATPTMRQAVRRFNRVRSIEDDEETGLVTLAFEWSDPRLAAEWANSFVKMLNNEMRQRAISEAEQSITYLEEELKKTNVVEIRSSIYSLIEEQIQSIMLANVREEFAFQILDPAVVPEPGELVRPRRVLMIALGFILGTLLSGFIVFFRNVLRAAAKADGDSDR